VARTTQCAVTSSQFNQASCVQGTASVPHEVTNTKMIMHSIHTIFLPTTLFRAAAVQGGLACFVRRVGWVVPRRRVRPVAQQQRG